KPMASAANEMPPLNSGLPKVKRGTAVSLSRPTVPTMRPSTIMIAVFTREPAEIAEITQSASRINTTSTAGPVATSAVASGGRGEEKRREGREGAAEEAAGGGDHQCRAGAALARHLVAVDAGHHRRRFAGNSHQDRRGRAAVHGAVEDTGQHDDADRRIEPEGEGQQKRHARERSEPGQHADHGPPQAANEAIGERLPGQRDREPAEELLEAGHLTIVPCAA